MCVNLLSMMINENPANMLEMKNRTGMLDEYHSGWILEGAVRNKPPSPAWCSVDSVTPRMTVAVVIFWMIRRALTHFSHSAIAGETSTNRQRVYRRKCQATRKSTDPYPNAFPMMGLTTFQGRPRSSRRAPL